METHSSHHTQWEASATDYLMSSLQTFTPQEQATLRTASVLTEYPVSNSSNTRKSETRGKTHICHVPGCNKIYKDVSRLRAHLVWHSGKRPFVCDWQSCGKTFYRSDELQRHRRTHTREKRFQCNECDKTFIRRDHLSQHLRGHQHRKNFARQSEF